MNDPKYYIIAKSIYDKYVDTTEYDNVYDFVNKPLNISQDLIIEDHIDTITSLYYDLTKVSNDEWNLILNEIREMFIESNDKEL